jgi:dynactin 1
VDALQTKIKHLEKQHSDDQARLKELSQAKDERDRYHGIIQKLQTKLQTFHQESTEAKEQLKELQVDNERLLKAEQDHELDLEDALLEREMAQERAEQNESELEALRAKVEERDLELEILREEAEAFTADMSEEEKEQAGYYRLQHENGRLREALVLLKEVTEEEAHRSKARIAELEEDTSQLEMLQNEFETVQQHLVEVQGIAEHLKAQVNDRNELEDVVEDLSSKIQELESRVADQELTIQDLESLKELNEELLDQQDEEMKENRAEFEIKDTELAELGQRALEQAVAISDLEETNMKFRDLVLELHAQIAEAESSKTMTEAQVKDTTGRINEVMDVNRRLRAAEVNATSKEITSELRQLRADETTEMLHIWSETQSQEFGRSEPMQAYFAAKRIAFKSTVLSNLLATADKHTNHTGGVEEAASKLLCVEATYYLASLKSGGERISSAMAVSTLPQFATFGPAYAELVAVERNLDQGLEALKADRVNFSELAKSFGGSTEVYKAVLASHQTVLAERPEDETMLRIRSIAAGLTYLDSVCAATNTMLKSLATASEDMADEAQHALERFVTPSASCSKGMLAATKLLKTCSDRRADGLYPQFNGDFGSVTEAEEYLSNAAREASKWAHNAVEVLSRSIDPDGTILEPVDLKSLLLSYWEDRVGRIDSLVPSLSSWSEYASLLKDSVEIQHGPAPWTEKAKEVETTRRQVDEAATKLQSITAEHQATLLKLHEREQVIETKELEIEHLAAKHREATSKSEDLQRLQQEIEEAQTEMNRLQKQDRAQQQQIDDLNNKLAHAAQYEPTELEKAPVVTTPGPEPAETTSRSAPASLMSLLDALQVENRWLRQKNHSNAFAAKQLDLFSTMRPIGRFEASKLSAATDSLLSLAWLSDDFEQPETLTSISTSQITSESELKSHPEPASKTHSQRPRRAPLSLAPLETQLNSMKSNGRLDYPGIDDLSFADLSPTMEFFDSKMVGLRPLRSIMAL